MLSCSSRTLCPANLWLIGAKCVPSAQRLAVNLLHTENCERTPPKFCVEGAPGPCARARVGVGGGRGGGGGYTQDLGTNLINDLLEVHRHHSHLQIAMVGGVVNEL